MGFASIRHTNRLTSSRYIAVSVRIMQNVAITRCRYSSHHVSTRTNFTVHDRAPRHKQCYSNPTKGNRNVATALPLCCVTRRYVARISATLPSILEEDFCDFAQSLKANGGTEPPHIWGRHFAKFCLHTYHSTPKALVSWSSSVKYGTATQELEACQPPVCHGLSL
jgi:hypothetical protein